MADPASARGSERGLPIQILVLDDDEETLELVGGALEREGYQVTLTTTFDEAERRVAPRVFDVLVLDVMLRERSGLELCATLRASGVDTPVLFLSARGAVRSRVEGFDAGGDDYLPKPFALRELCARVRALVRRGRPALAEPSKIKLGELQLDFEERQASSSAGDPVPFTGREWMLLALLVEAHGRVVSFDELLARAWGETGEGPRASLVVIMSRLRRKLDSTCGRSVLRTVRGLGYSLASEP